MRKQIPVSLFETSDLVLAATLHYFGYPIEDFGWEDKRRCTFSFIDGDELRAKVSLFWAGKLLTEPQSLFAKVKMLKSRLYGSHDRH